MTTWVNFKNIVLSKMSATKRQILYGLYGCQPQIGTCPSTSTRITSSAAAAADFQHPLKGVQGGEQKGGTLRLGKKLAGQVFRQLLIDIFRSWFYESNSCISSYLEKH